MIDWFGTGPERPKRLTEAARGFERLCCEGADDKTPVTRQSSTLVDWWTTLCFRFAAFLEILAAVKPPVLRL